jgi:hypothetical protein
MSNRDAFIIDSGVGQAAKNLKSEGRATSPEKFEK